MIGTPEFVILEYQPWLGITKFGDKILGSIVKEFLRPTNDHVPDMCVVANSAVGQLSS